MHCKKSALLALSRLILKSSLTASATISTYLTGVSYSSSGWVPQTPGHFRISGTGSRWLDTTKFRTYLWQNKILNNTHTNTHLFNSRLSGTTQVSWYQKGKTSLDFTETRDSEWQWHQLGHMQVCTSLQTDDHTNIPPLSFYRPKTE